MRIFALSAAIALCTTTLQAEDFGFFGVTSNDPTGSSVAAAEAGLGLSVSDLGGGQISMTITNNSASAFFVRNVYFDDNAGVLGGMTGMSGTGGVQFGVGGNPADLPGGTDVGFESDFNVTAPQSWLSLGNWQW